MGFYGSVGAQPILDGVILYREIPLFTQYVDERVSRTYGSTQDQKVTGGTHIYDREGFRMVCNKLEKDQAELFKMMPSVIVGFHPMDRLPSSYEVTAFEATSDEVYHYNNSVHDAIVALGLEIKAAFDPLHGLVIEEPSILRDALQNPNVLTLASGGMARVNYLPGFASELSSDSDGVYEGDTELLYEGEDDSAESVGSVES